MLKVPAVYGLVFFGLLAFGAVSLTIILAPIRRRSLEPLLDYLAAEIEAAERGAAAHYLERSVADQEVRLTLAESPQ